MSRAVRGRRDGGNAVVEFVWLAVLLMVPLMYIMLGVFDVQRASFGVTEAARQAGRTFATECASGTGAARARAQQAASMALADQGYAMNRGIAGLDACPPAGQSTRVVVTQFVTLPGLGALLPRDRGGIEVSGSFVAYRDRFAP